MTEKQTYERMRERDVGLGPWSKRAVTAVIEAVFARAGEDGEVTPPPEARVAWVTAELDDFLARASARTYVLVLLSLVAVSVIAPLLSWRFASFASLTPKERVHALDRFEHSGLAPALLAVKGLLAVHYYEHPDAAREVGYDGACMITPGAP